MLPQRKLWIKRISLLLIMIAVLMNVIAALHAYQFTHFSEPKGAKAIAKSLSFFDKLKAVFVGVNNPRPQNQTLPSQPFTEVVLQSNKKIACWLIPKINAKGTVIIFHGFGGDKSSMLDKSDLFLKLGYQTLLVDFMGSGGSEGNQTTIGFKEAAQVKTCYQYLRTHGEQNIILFGTSMGAVAVMKAISDHQLQPNGVIIECPFGSLYETVAARFRIVGIPVFPMAGLLTFWGGLENGFWAFDHRPKEDAKAITCPTLLMYGEQDNRVSRTEINEIYGNLGGPKTLKTFASAGHENYLTKYSEQWVLAVQRFLQQVN